MGARKSDEHALLRRVPEGMPAIAPALRNDWGTPEPVLEPVYEILWPARPDEPEPVGIDPCSNKDSIVKSTHAIVLPDGADVTQIVGGLAEDWHKHGTFFCNPPFGAGVINLWVAKAIAEAKLGAEGILLLPAHVSAYFFDDLWNAADVICFWGKPGETTSRVKFLGAKDSAPFPIMLAYFGPRVALAADVLARVGQMVIPSLMQSWLHIIRGDVIPAMLEAAVDEDSFTDPIYVAMRRACRNQYDDLIAACACAESKTVADLAGEDHPLIHRLLDLTVGEIAGGLAALQRVEPRPRAMPTTRRVVRARVPRQAREATEDDDPQLSLIQRSPAQKAREDLDAKVLATLRANARTSNEKGLLAAELRLRVQCTPARFRTSMNRLIAANLITKIGASSDTRYYSID
jgi:hypothetical protein